MKMKALVVVLARFGFITLEAVLNA